MDVEKSSLCNCVVNFLLEENYLLTAFELLHELLEDGRDVLAIRLKEFFSDPAQFPPDQIAHFSSLRIADPQSLLEEKESLEEKLAISQYELRLAQEDLLKLKEELQNQLKHPLDESDSHAAASVGEIYTCQQRKREGPFLDMGPLKDTERRDLNCAIKEYLLFAGYRLTAMTFYEEVTDQDLDVWQNSPACIPDALRHYYYEYLSSTPEAAEEKIAILRERESLLKENEMLNCEKDSLLKSKELADDQMIALTKSLESVQKDLKDRDILVQDLKQSLELQRKDLNDCRAEITSLKMHLEGSRASLAWAGAPTEHLQASQIESYKKEIKSLQTEIERLKLSTPTITVDFKNHENEDSNMNEVEIHEDKMVTGESHDTVSGPPDAVDPGTQNFEMGMTAVTPPKNGVLEPLDECTFNGNSTLINNGNVSKNDSEHPLEHESRGDRLEDSIKMGLETIQILSDALPKIVPYVLINHREELIPLIMCAIERHPDSITRDSLTHTLFNLIKRPDEKQRRIIMDACVSLAKNIGEMRTESELLPQCWEQINHVIEERRLLVAQSCGELAEFVRPEICDSLILSIVQQLIEDSAIVVREAAGHNLALLLPLFPNMDKYFKVEEIMFQLVCDPSGAVVETTLKELVPAVINWGNKLDHILRVVLSHILGSAQRCPPLSGVEGSVDSHLRVLGERERWNIEVLLRMLTELLPFVYRNAIESCPFPSARSLEHGDCIFSPSLLQMYAGGHFDWPAFEWMHMDCFPDIIQLCCLLPQKEDNLRTLSTKFLLSVSELFGDHYVTHIMLPVFMVAVGDESDLSLFPIAVQSRIKGLRPKTALAEKIAIMCVLPLLLAGILGAPSRHEKLADYLRKLLIQNTMKDSSWSAYCTADIIDAVRFLCTFKEYHGIVFNILWEMVVSSNPNMKIRAANLLKALVPYMDVKVASSHVLPALVTLGSDQNLSVKYASIETFGAVAQHFKSDTIVDKIRIQMDAFLEDGSHEATVAVIRALSVAVPHTTDTLRDYLLSKIFQMTSMPPQGNNMMHRREKANVFCESIRALDATDLSVTSVREYLLPAIQNMLKDSESLDPAHKEALEVILKERSGGTLETISKVMGAGIASSMSSFFGESGLLGRKDGVDSTANVTAGEAISTSVAVSSQTPTSGGQLTPENTTFKRIMMGNFGDMLRGKVKVSDESPQKK